MKVVSLSSVDIFLHTLNRVVLSFCDKLYYSIHNQHRILISIYKARHCVAWYGVKMNRKDRFDCWSSDEYPMRIGPHNDWLPSNLLTITCRYCFIDRFNQIDIFYWQTYLAFRHWNRYDKELGEYQKSLSWFIWWKMGNKTNLPKSYLILIFKC